MSAFADLNQTYTNVKLTFIQLYVFVGSTFVDTRHMHFGRKAKTVSVPLTYSKNWFDSGNGN